MKKYKGFVAPILVCLVPLIVGAMLYSKLPDSMPTHFNFAGEADGFSSKGFAIFGLPLILAGVELLMPWILEADPKYKNMSPALVKVTIWIVPVITVTIQMMVFAKALGYAVDIRGITFLLVGIMFVMVGNYLPKTKQSYTMGIKLPWTLNSEENWDRTHRFGGYVWVVCGVVMLICTFVQASEYVFMVCMLVAILVPTVYSYLLYKKGI